VAVDGDRAVRAGGILRLREAARGLGRPRAGDIPGSEHLWLHADQR